MIPLVKFCKPEHNILDRTHTLRMGTLEYYRSLDPQFMIADPTEGTESTVIQDIDTSTATSEAVSAIGPFINLPNVQISNIVLNTHFPNCYIWCCSRCAQPTKDEGAKFDPGYKSWYKIPDPARFAEYLVFLMMAHVTRDNFAEGARSKIDSLSMSEMGEFSLNVFHRDVLYVDQKIQTISTGQLNPYVSQIPPLLRPVFVKPTKYANDREYRFICIFEHKRHGVLPVLSTPLNLPIVPAESI